MTRHVDTNYAITDASQFGQFILGWKDVHIYQTALTAANYLNAGTGPEGTYVLVPSASDHSWTQIRAFTRRLWQDPATGVTMADTKVVVVSLTTGNSSQNYHADRYPLDRHSHKALGTFTPPGSKCNAIVS